MTYTEGDVYEGAWSANLKCGYGVNRHSNGTVYRGWWLRGYQHGRGHETWNNLNQSVLNMTTGSAESNMAEGGEYIGDYRDGKKEGEGVYKWKDGSHYYGSWEDNQIHGAGVHEWTDGRCYMGQWKDGKMHGIGRYTWSD